jgi:ferritin-like metal-binding protein YciE
MREVDVTISNSRGLLVQLLGELLYAERRFADEILASLAREANDDELRAALEQHRAETLQHVDRIETAFRKLEVAPTSNRVAEVESMVTHHRELAGAVADPSLCDLVHAQAALDAEHWEISRYRTLLAVAPKEVGELLQETLDEEKRAANALLKLVERQAG